jgi:pimeloyl-ACP methyl ester carboxylesterase
VIRLARLPHVAFVVAVTAVLLAGCVAPPSRWAGPISGRAAPSGRASAGTAEWSPCPEISPKKLPNITFECATIKVPQDWSAQTNGKTFDLSLVRARASGQNNRIGSLVVNPGGPGASGLDLAVGLANALPIDVLFRFDLVGFDPRGVGRSSPVECFSDADLDAFFGSDPDPVSQADFDSAVALSKRMAQSCGDKYRETLPLFSTEQAARDMDAVRIAVGDEKITYLGYSYGTLLGAVYAHLFPGNVRALVLDGAVDPSVEPLADLETQTKGFERAFDNFAAWCKAKAGQCPIGPDARATVMDTLQSSRTSPVAGPAGRKATAGWIMTAIIASLYDAGNWPNLATAVANVRRGNAVGVFQLADSYAHRDTSGRYTNLFDALLAVNCTDEDKPISVEQSRQLQGEWRVKYPLFGASMALNLICPQWPGKRDPYPVGEAKGAPPIVVVGTKGDPATPYEQTPKLAKLLGVGVVLTYEGEGHTVYPFNRCINAAVNAYLIDVKPPPDGQSCPR